MENSITTTTGGNQTQISVSPLNTPIHMFVPYFGGQNLPESTTIRIYEISRFNSGGTTVATFPIREYEEHHPTSEFESSNDQDDQRVMATLSIELLNQGGTIGVSNEEIDNLTRTENVLPDIETQNESTATSMVNPGDDSSNHPLIATQIAKPPHTALLHDYSNPKIGTYFVGVYPTITTLLSFKFIAQKYSPFDTHIPFMIISIVAYLMAILDLAILFCLYDTLKRPSNQHFSRGNYKILTYAYYILWILAMVLVVPTLFTPQPKEDP